MSIYGSVFWKSAGERAIRTFAQTLLASFTLGGTVFHLDWLNALDITVGATLLSVLTSVVNAGITNSPAPSLTEVPTSLVKKESQP